MRTTTVCIERGQAILAHIEQHGGTIADACRALDFNIDTGRRYVQYVRKAVPLMPAPDEHVIPIQEDHHDDLVIKHPRHKSLLRAALFDIEVTDFDAAGEEGQLISCCILPLDSDDIQTIRIEFDDLDDRRVLEETLIALSEYDILIGHNIAAFDLNWLYTRADWYDMLPLRTWWYIDTYQSEKSRATRKGGKSLGVLGDFHKLEGEKTTIFMATWSEVRSKKQSIFDATMHHVIEHCQGDVIRNRNLFWVQFPHLLTLRNAQIKQTKWSTGLVPVSRLVPAEV